MSSSRLSVLATDAKSAGLVRELTRLTPRPPSFTGRLAWSHWVSDKSELAMRCTAILNSESKCWRDGVISRVSSAEDGGLWEHWRTIWEESKHPVRSPNSVSQPPLLDPRIDQTMPGQEQIQWTEVLPEVWCRWYWLLLMTAKGHLSPRNLDVQLVQLLSLLIILLLL